MPDQGSLLQVAVAYAQMGWSVFPLRPLSKVPATRNGFKDATTDPRVITAWWTETPNANIGIATGASNLFVIDVDTKNGKKGAETLAALETEHGALPKTYTVRTWSGGWQHYFQMPEPRLRNSTGTEKAGLGPDVDTRGDGGYVVAAPSMVEEDGKRGQYWGTVKVRPAELPAWVPEKLDRKPYVPPGRPSTPPVTQRGAEPINGSQGAPEGLRRYIEQRCAEVRAMPPASAGKGSPATQPLNDIAFELAQFAPHQISVEELRTALRAAVDSWEDGHEKGYAGIEQGLKDAGKEPRVWEERRTRRTAPRTSDQFADSFLAESVVADVLAGTYRFVPGLEWKCWTGKVWRQCDELEVAEQVRQWAVRQYQGALDQERQEPGSVPGEIMNGWRRTLRGDKQATVLKMTRGFEGVFTLAEELDRNPDLLNAQNCVVNLITGEPLPHDPDLLMTKMAGAEYRPGYRHPDWDKVLEAVPDDTREWLQIRQGQATTGHTPPDDLLVVTQGSGENGKTTENATVARALGDYFTLLSDRVLMADPSAHPTELMDLMGVRFAVLEETPEARRLDTQRLKRTVGTPQITARRMRQDPVTYTATHAMFISTNFRPEITETDHGSWRRLALLTFPYRFRKPGEELVSPDDRHGDPGLRARCENNPDVHTATLTWLVEGAQRWYAAERVMPPLPGRVETDTLEWRKESDMALAFITEQLVFDPDRHVRASDLLEELNRWLAEKRMNPWNAKTLATRIGGHDEFRSRGVVNKPVKASARLSEPVREPGSFEPYKPRTTTYKAWVGVRFRTTTDDVEEAIQDTGEEPPVTAVTAALVPPIREPFAQRNNPSGNSGNRPGQSDPTRTPGRPFVPPKREDR
ncbi:hypothetical protein ADL25_22270 [Streptomyces sp. NRRL F-5122]|uniref:phage/plasmid primase, P4 family n=1 Tax=Streptomyces sp. NRRL F-5122 TaxID=1609098 RepID=UPI000741283A|nr:phage/plasmid primase, P4 family [Streptomyces sp. NRRL F-5122]KUJ38962.1 hypothetical protein ADL25_22270 [Streptomyces sp. NRRL F-5122]